MVANGHQARRWQRPTFWGRSRSLPVPPTPVLSPNSKPNLAIISRKETNRAERAGAAGARLIGASLSADRLLTSRPPSPHAQPCFSGLRVVLQPPGRATGKALGNPCRLSSGFALQGVPPSLPGPELRGGFDSRLSPEALALGLSVPSSVEWEEQSLPRPHPLVAEETGSEQL